ncbi:MAG: exosortase E/protease, VPEID-CTERM system [Fuerstiella sp.]
MGLLLLLAAEVLALTIRFDAQGAVRDNQLVTALTNNVSLVPQLLAVVVTATLIFGGGGVSQILAGILQEISSHRTWPRWLSMHLALMVAFSLTTAYVLEINPRASTGFFALWIFLGTASFAAWLAATAPPQSWPRIGASLAGPVQIGAVIGVCGWLGGQWAREFWRPLASVTFRSVGFLLSAFGMDVVQDTSEFVLGTSVFAVRVAPQCSGYEGMGLAVVFVTTYLWLRRADHYFPRSLLLIPISVALMFLANVLRISGLITIGHLGWGDFAVGGFHSQAGWLGFNAVALLILTGARISPFFCRPAVKNERPESLQSVPMLMPFIVLMLTVMITGALQSGFDWLYPVRVIAVVTAFACVSRQFPPGIWTWTRDWAAVGIGVAVYALWIALEPFNTGTSAQSAMSNLQGQSSLLVTGWFCFRLIGSVITVPLAEEFAFRGYLLPWLTPSAEAQDSTKRSWMALLLSSAAFGVLHPGRWIAGTVAGCLFGIAWYRRRRLMDAVLAHATTNLMIAVQAITTGDFSLWS